MQSKKKVVSKPVQKIQKKEIDYFGTVIILLDIY